MRLGQLRLGSWSFQTSRLNIHLQEYVSLDTFCMGYILHGQNSAQMAFNTMVLNQYMSCHVAILVLVIIFRTSFCLARGVYHREYLPACRSASTTRPVIVGAGDANMDPRYILFARQKTPKGFGTWGMDAGWARTNHSQSDKQQNKKQYTYTHSLLQVVLLQHYLTAIYLLAMHFVLELLGKTCPF